MVREAQVAVVTITGSPRSYHILDGSQFYIRAAIPDHTAIVPSDVLGESALGIGIRVFQPWWLRPPATTEEARG